MKKETPFRMATFMFSREKYGCYIYFGAFDHKTGTTFVDKIRDISPYCKFSGFEKIREHYNNRKLEIIEYINREVIPRINEAIIKGSLDRGLDTKHWTALLQRRRSAEFIPIGDLIEEYIQARYLKQESVSNKDLYRDGLRAFKTSLKAELTPSVFNKTTIGEITEEICIKVFKNWENFVFDNINTRKAYRHKVKIFFEDHISIIKANPVTRKTAIKGSGKDRNIPLLHQDYQKIIKHLETSTKRKHKELLGFCYLMYCGLLRGDTIYQLKGENFKKEADGTYMLEVFADMVKNSQGGNIVIPTDVIEFLIKHEIYDPTKPDKLLFPPVFKKRPSRESTRNQERSAGHLRNRMWASNLWNDVLRNELAFGEGFTRKHNVYCLKATGALYLLNEEKWDIREISAQMLHKNLMTTFTYIAKLRHHNVDKKKRIFASHIVDKNTEAIVSFV